LGWKVVAAVLLESATLPESATLQKTLAYLTLAYSAARRSGAKEASVSMKEEIWSKN